MTIKFRAVGRVAVLAQDGDPPTPEEWTKWVALCQKVQPLGGRVVITTLGGAPTVKQRAVLAEALKGKPLPSIVFTESPIARCVATAVSWLGVPVRALKPGEFSEMQKYLDLTRDEVDECRRMLSLLSVSLAG